MDITKIRQISLTIERICDIKFSNELSTIEHIKSHVLKDKTFAEYYNDLFKSFESKLEELKKDSYQKGIFELLLNQMKPLIAPVKSKYLQHLSNSSKENAIKYSEYVKSGRHKFFRELHRFQYQTITKVENRLKDEIKYFVSTSNQTDTVNSTVINKSGTYPPKPKPTNRVVFSLGKKQVIIFIYVLEKSGIISFANEEHRRVFIEDNFSYTELRKNENEGRKLEMINVNSDIAKVKGGHHSDENNNTLGRMVKNFIQIFEDFKFTK